MYCMHHIYPLYQLWFNFVISILYATAFSWRRKERSGHFPYPNRQKRPFGSTMVGSAMVCAAWPLDPQWLALPRVSYKREDVTDAIIEEHCNEICIGSYVVQVRGGGGFHVPWYLTRGDNKLPNSVKLKGVVYGPVHAKETADGFVSILVPPPRGLKWNRHEEDALPS